MDLMLKGDYYVWVCDWCDSTNQTIWTRFEKKEIHCTACQRRVSINGSTAVSPNKLTRLSSYNLF
jgi:hypothetical protein